MSLSEKREMGPSHPPEEMLTFAHTCTSVEEEKGAEAGGAEGFGLGWEANGGGSGLGVLSPRFTEEEIQPRAAQVCFACSAQPAASARDQVSSVGPRAVLSFRSSPSAYTEMLFLPS